MTDGVGENCVMRNLNYLNSRDDSRMGHAREGRQMRRKVFVRKPEGKRPLPRPSHRWHINVEFERDNYDE